MLEMRLQPCDARGVTDPEGFRHQARKNGDVVIFHHGKAAGVLRGAVASSFLTDLAQPDVDGQALMARATGNDRRGNERVAASHPRNRR